MGELTATPPSSDSSEPVSELFQELPPLVARGLVYLLFGLLTAIGIYSVVGEVDEIVAARAVVVPRGGARPLQAASAGRVTRVAAREGDLVTDGQVLVYLEMDAALGLLQRALQKRETRERQLQDQLTRAGDSGLIAESRARLTEAEEGVATAQRDVEASTILAPLDGQITRLAVRGPGETVQQGQTVAELAPLGEPLVFEARVSTSDIGRVSTGQRVKAKVDAYPHQRYGLVDGHVSDVSPDVTVTGREPAAFSVLVTPELRTQRSSRRSIPLRLGLTATAEIVTARRRLVELLLRSLSGEG